LPNVYAQDNNPSDDSNKELIKKVMDKVDKKDINLHGHVSLDKDAAESIGKSISSVGSNIGLGASIAGAAAAVSKGVSKSSLPPLQKAGIIVGGGLIGGTAYSALSSINRNRALDDFVRKNNSDSNNSSGPTNVPSNNNSASSGPTDTPSGPIVSNNAASNIDKNISNDLNNNICSDSGNNLNNYVNKFMDDNLSSLSPLQELLFDVQIINYVCLYMIMILFIQILFKFHLENKNLNINFSRFIGFKFNEKLNYYINKLILLNKKMSIFYT